MLRRRERRLFRRARVGVRRRIVNHRCGDIHIHRRVPTTLNCHSLWCRRLREHILTKLIEHGRKFNSHTGLSMAREVGDRGTSKAGASVYINRRCR